MKRIIALIFISVMVAFSAYAASPVQYNPGAVVPTGIDSSTGKAAAPYIDHASGALTVQVNGASGSGVVQVSEVSGINASSVSITTSAVVVDTSVLKFPMTVTVVPGSGDTATVEFSTTQGAATTPGSANWSVLGAVSGVAATNTVTLPSPVTALRFTRVSGATAVTGELNW